MYDLCMCALILFGGILVLAAFRGYQTVDQRNKYLRDIRDLLEEKNNGKSQ